MRIIIIIICIFVCGCRSVSDSRWESSVNTSTRIYTDKPNAIEAIDFSASLKRNW